MLMDLYAATDARDSLDALSTSPEASLQLRTHGLQNTIAAQHAYVLQHSRPAAQTSLPQSQTMQHNINSTHMHRAQSVQGLVAHLQKLRCTNAESQFSTNQGGRGSGASNSNTLPDQQQAQIISELQFEVAWRLGQWDDMDGALTTGQAATSHHPEHQLHLQLQQLPQEESSNTFHSLTHAITQKGCSAVNRDVMGCSDTMRMCFTHGWESSSCRFHATMFAMLRDLRSGVKGGLGTLLQCATMGAASRLVSQESRSVGETGFHDFYTSSIFTQAPQLTPGC